MKTLICAELGCVYRFNEQFQVLEFCPIVDNIFHEEEWSQVSEDLVGEEVVTYKNKKMQLSDVYRDVEELLK